MRSACSSRPPIAAYLALDRTGVVVIGVAIFAVGLLTPSLRGVLQGVHDFHSFSLSLWVEGAVKTLFGVGLVYLGFRAEGALAGILLAGICAALFALWRIRRDVGTTAAALHLDVRRLATTMIGVTLATAALTTLTYMDVILVKHYFSPETAGIYSAVALVGKTILFFVGFLPVVVLPHVTARAASGQPTRTVLVQAGGVLLAILLVSLGAFFVVPDKIMAIAAGSRYAAGNSVPVRLRRRDGAARLHLVRRRVPHRAAPLQLHAPDAGRDDRRAGRDRAAPRLDPRGDRRDDRRQCMRARRRRGDAGAFEAAGRRRREGGVRTIILANVVWPEYGIEAGGTQHALAVANELTNHGDVAVVVPAFTVAPIAARYPRLTLLPTPSPRALLGSTIGTLLFSAVSWLRRARTIRRAEGVLAASQFLGDVLPAGLLHPRHAAVIVHHLVEPPWRRRGPFARNLLGYLHERLSLAVVRALAGSIVTSSAHVRAQLRALGFRQPIVVTTNAPRPLSAPPPPLGARVAKRVLYVGRLSPTKGIEHLIEAWPIIAAAAPGATLHVVGDGDPEYRRALEARARTYAPDGAIRFLGRVGDDRKEAELFEAAVFAFPSLEEGFGIAIAEAMQAGLPCVTFDLPVFRELFVEGRVAVPIGNSAAFGAALARLLTDEPGARRSRSARCTGAGDFTWRRAAQLDAEAVELAGRGRAPV